MAGLFGSSFDDPETQGILGAALQMLAASGPSPRRTSIGQIIGTGGLAGMEQYRLGKRQKMVDEEGQRRNKITDMQIRKMERDLAEEQQIADAARASTMNRAQMALGAGAGPTNEAAAAMDQMPEGATGFDQQAFTNRLFGINPMLALRMQAEMRAKNKPMPVGSNVYLPDTGEWKTPPQQDKGMWVDDGVSARGQLIQRHSVTGEKRAVGSGPVIGSINVAGAKQEPEFLKNVEKGQAESFNTIRTEAVNAAQSLPRIDRIRQIISQGEVSGGPLARWEVFGRNVAAQMGVPIDKVIDRNNARFQSEASDYIASQILKGGRGLTDSDRVVIEEAWPGFRSGIPFDQLPAFLDQMENIASSKIDYFREYLNTVPQEYRAARPATFADPTEPLTRNRKRPTTRLPQGSKFIGTSGGKRVYETPDGKRFIEE